MELTSLQEHSKNTSTCGTILTENQQETGRKTHTTKAVRKIHTDSGRKRREAIKSGIVTLGGDTEKEGDYMDSEILPGG